MDVMTLREKSQRFTGRRYVLVGVLLIVSLIGFVVPGSMYATRERATDARVVAVFVQLRAMAELIYQEKSSNSYENLRCEYDDTMQLLCKDVENQSGIKPVIHSTTDKYCAYGVLPLMEQYICIDSGGANRYYYTYISPGGAGFCDGTTFVCPVEIGVPSSSSQSHTLRTILLLAWVLMLGFVVFVWIHAIKKRRVHK